MKGLGTMKFEIHGGFEIKRTTNRRGMKTGVFDKAFWEAVHDEYPNLPNACGCYVFAIQNGEKITPWYIGKTERNTFRGECFQSSKREHYNTVISAYNGRPLLFLIPKLTGAGKDFCKSTTYSYGDVNFLETLLIGMALEQNPNLSNIGKTKYLRNIVIRGFLNDGPARPSTAASKLRKAFGI